jgi:trk system potassium uptake protein TrkA
MKKRNFAVIGLGTFGSSVASELTHLGNHVLGIDCEEGPVSRLVETLTEAIIADARDDEALREAGVGNCDVAVIAIGEDIEASIICTMNVKMLGVSCIWVKAITKMHHRILSKLGADRVIEPEQEIGHHVAQKLHNPLIRDYLSLGNGFTIVDIRIPERLKGENLESLGVQGGSDIRCLGVMRGTDFLPFDAGALVLQADDKLLLLGHPQSLREFSEKLW